MTYPAYVREKALQLRADRRLSIDEIAERLALPKTTVYSWVRHLPLARARRENQRPATLAMQRKFRLLREAAYQDGVDSFDSMIAADPTFRDFVCMHVGEGSKRDRNRVSLGNSDPRVVLLATRWLQTLSRNPLRFALQYHADQDPAKLREFWGRTLDIDPASVALQRKARLQGWMDCLQEQWLDSPRDGA
jgi:transposase-like protein